MLQDYMLLNCDHKESVSNKLSNLQNNLAFLDLGLQEVSKEDLGANRQALHALSNDISEVILLLRDDTKLPLANWEFNGVVNYLLLEDQVVDNEVDDIPVLVRVFVRVVHSQIELDIL